MSLLLIYSPECTGPVKVRLDLTVAFPTSGTRFCRASLRLTPSIIPLRTVMFAMTKDVNLTSGSLSKSAILIRSAEFR